MKKGLLINATQETVIRLLPAVNLSAEEADEGFGIIADVLREMASEAS
jgi:acetylornithine/succinyldiaminopimelate/putrescine aminotransferase